MKNTQTHGRISALDDSVPCMCNYRLENTITKPCTLKLSYGTAFNRAWRCVSDFDGQSVTRQSPSNATDEGAFNEFSFSINLRDDII